MIPGFDLISAGQELTDSLLQRVHPEYANREKLEALRQSVRCDWSTLAMRGTVVAGLCLVGGNTTEAEVLTVWVNPVLEPRALERAMLSRSVEQTLQSQVRSLVANLATEDLSMASLMVDLGFVWLPSMPELPLSWVQTSNALANQGRAQEAQEAYECGIEELGKLGDGRVEGLKFQATLLCGNSLLFWRNLEDVAPAKELETFFLETATPQAVCELAPLVESIFFEHPYKTLAPYFHQTDPNCSTVGYFVEGTIAGACLVDKRERGASVSYLLVSASARRQGLASGMLLRSLRLLRCHGCRCVMAQVHEANEASRSTFASLGFKQVETLEDLLEYGALSGSIPYLSLLRIVGKASAKEAVKTCWSQKIAVLYPPP